MRSVKKGNLKFGLINAPVKMFKAWDDHDVHFHQHHAACVNKPNRGAIRMPKVCEDCGVKVDYNDILSGIEVDQKLVVFNRQELDQLVEEQDPGFDVVQFVNKNEVDPILFENTQLLEADKDGEKLYALILKTLTVSKWYGVVRFTQASKTHMGILGVHRDKLVIHTLRWIDEIRDTADLPGSKKKITLIPEEVEAMKKAIESRVEPWNPEKYSDAYTERLREAVAVKADGEEFEPITRDDDEDVPEDVSDLVAMLQASVKEAA